MLWFLRKSSGTQISARQLDQITRAIRRFPGCNFLVFGLGYDSTYWHRLNRNGLTVFLENNQEWIDRVSARVPGLNIEPVSYWTRQKDWKALSGRLDELVLDLPDELTRRPWDIVLVDGPEGWNDATPGRMQSICTAAALCRKGGIVFVHDCERAAEAFWCDHIFERELLEREIPGPRKQGWLRQYRSAGGGRRPNAVEWADA